MLYQPIRPQWKYFYAVIYHQLVLNSSFFGGSITSHSSRKGLFSRITKNVFVSTPKITIFGAHLPKVERFFVVTKIIICFNYYASLSRINFFCQFIYPVHVNNERIFFKYIFDNCFTGRNWRNDFVCFPISSYFLSRTFF